MFLTHPPLFNFRSRIIDWFLVMDKRSKDGELVLIRALPRRSREIVFKCVKTQKMKSWMWSELCLEGQRVSPHGHAHPGGRVNHWRRRPFGSVGLGDGLKLQVFSDTSGHRDAQPPPTPPPGVAQPPLPGVPQPPPETKPFQGKETWEVGNSWAWCQVWND